MSKRRGLLEQLAAADQALADDRLSPRAVRRIAARLSVEVEQRRRFGWVPMATFAAGAGLVLLFLAWVRGGSGTTEPEGPTHAPVAAATVTVSGSGCERDPHDGDAVQVRGVCQIVNASPGLRIDTADTEQRAEVGLDGRTATVRKGSAIFDVDRVVGEPVRVQIPGGEIVVVGTRFRVAVADGVTSIDLYEGHLEFVADDGRTTPIAAGERLNVSARSFAKAALVAEGADPHPRVEVPEPPPAPVAVAAPVPSAPVEPVRARPAPTKRAGTKPKTLEPADDEPVPPVQADAGAVIERVKTLQRRGDYEGAVAVLRAALRDRRPPRTAEVLSNELGRVLARRLKDPVRACAHWKAHLKRFEDSRYRKQIEASMVTLQCR